MLWFPAVFKFLIHSAAALREACIAKFATIGEHFAPSGIYGIAHALGALARDALITLAMVIGTHVEVHMVFAVIPLNHLVFATFLASLVVLMLLGDALVLVDLRQEPAARNHGMCLEQLERCSSTHLARNHTQQIIFHRQHIHSRELPVLHYQMQGTAESLVLLALPVEIHTDGNAFKLEEAILRRLKCNHIGNRAVPSHLPLGSDLGMLLSGHNSAIGKAIFAKKHEIHLRLIHYAYFHARYSTHIISICSFFILY